MSYSLVPFQVKFASDACILGLMLEAASVPAKGYQEFAKNGKVYRATDYDPKLKQRVPVTIREKPSPVSAPEKQFVNRENVKAIGVSIRKPTQEAGGTIVDIRSPSVRKQLVEAISNGLAEQYKKFPIIADQIKNFQVAGDNVLKTYEDLKTQFQEATKPENIQALAGKLMKVSIPIAVSLAIAAAPEILIPLLVGGTLNWATIAGSVAVGSLIDYVTQKGLDMAHVDNAFARIGISLIAGAIGGGIAIKAASKIKNFDDLAAIGKEAMDSLKTFGKKFADKSQEFVDGIKRSRQNLKELPGLIGRPEDPWDVGYKYTEWSLKNYEEAKKDLHLLDDKNLDFAKLKMPTLERSLKEVGLDPEEVRKSLGRINKLKKSKMSDFMDVSAINIKECEKRTMARYLQRLRELDHFVQVRRSASGSVKDADRGIYTMRKLNSHISLRKKIIYGEIKYGDIYDKMIHSFKQSDSSAALTKIANDSKEALIKRLTKRDKISNPPSLLSKQEYYEIARSGAERVVPPTPKTESALKKALVIIEDVFRLAEKTPDIKLAPIIDYSASGNNSLAHMRMLVKGTSRPGNTLFAPPPYIMGITDKAIGDRGGMSLRAIVSHEAGHVLEYSSPELPAQSNALIKSLKIGKDKTELVSKYGETVYDEGHIGVVSTELISTAMEFLGAKTVSFFTLVVQAREQLNYVIGILDGIT